MFQLYLLLRLKNFGRIVIELGIIIGKTKCERYKKRNAIIRV